MNLIHSTIGEYLGQTARTWGAGTALVQARDGQRLNWGEVDALTDLYARGFLQSGLRRGDRLLLWSGNSIPLALCCLAAMKIGVIPVPVSIHLKEQEFKNCLLLSDATALCFADGYRDVDYSETVRRIWADESFGRAFPAPGQRLLVNLGSRAAAGSVTLDAIAALGAKFPEDAYLAARNAVRPEDPACILFTSGSTATPKAVILSHFSLLNNAFSSMRRLGLRRQDTVCLPIPLFHSFGLSAGLIGCIDTGAALVLLETYNPGDTLRCIETYGCTTLHGVPTMFSRILNQADFARYDISSLRKGILAGSSCPPDLVRNIVERMGMRELCVSYGQTETSPCCTQTEPDDSIGIKCGSIGKPIPFVEMKAIDPASGLEKDPGEVGEICTRGYHVMQGYFRAAQAAEQALDKDGWLHTGDMGFADADGRWHFVCRLKEIVIRGGENISPLEVECIVLEYPAVEAARVFGVPSAELGEEVAASIVLKDGVPFSEKKLREFLSGRLARYKIPSFISVIESMPLTACGKIDVRALKKEFAAGRLEPGRQVPAGAARPRADI